jgi:hypothetical protein
MQASLTTQVVQNKLHGDIFKPSTEQESDQAKLQAVNTVALQNPNYFSRFLEASCDCV